MNKIEFKKLDKEQMIIAFNQLKDDYSNLFNENQQLKEVIEEVREEIEKSILIEGVRETGVGYYENIKANKTKLLQILDKAKDVG